MPRPPWHLLLLLDAIDALRLQRSYAFASRPGEGNPASVGVLGLPDAWPEAPASGEATAFVRPAAAEDAYDVRYFAGGAEIAFCGHATLAAADAVLDSAPGARVDLETSSGKTVAATRSSDGAVELRLAAGVPAPALPDAVAATTAVLGVEAVDARFYDDTTLVVEVSPDDYASLDAVDAAALKDIRLVVAATTRAAGDLAFRSRCFVGGAEDLACGVAHCGLAPYWAPKIGGNGFMLARQDSPTGARLDVALDGDDVVLLRGRVSRDTFREKLRRGVRRLADALIAPLPKTRSIEDEAKIELVKGGVLRALFIGGTALASAWSLTLFGAKWTAPQWQAPRVKQPVLVAPKPKTPVFVKPQWRFKNDK